MQFDTLRAFPYPVLRPDVDDYVEGDMQVTVEFQPSADGQDVIATVQILLSVDDLKSEIASGNANYVTVFACRDTYYRHVVSDKNDSFNVNFPTGYLRGEVQIFSYVCAVKQITNYKCDWINKEFGSGPFSYDVGSVLAVDRPQMIYIDRDVFKPLASIFTLVKDDSIVGHEWQVKPTNDKVQIVVSPDLKEKIDIARNNIAHRAVLMNSIYFSAVMQCVCLLRRDEEESKQTRWGKVFFQKMHNAGINVNDHDEHLIAERLLKSPFKTIEAYVFKGDAP